MAATPDLDIRPADAGALRRPRDAVRGGRRPEVVLVHLLPRPRPRLDELDGGDEPRANSSPAPVTTRPPGLLAYRRRPRRRLGEPRAARDLRAARGVEGPRPGRRAPDLVDRLLRRVARPRAAGASRGRCSTPPSTTPGAHGATLLEAYPVDTAGERVPAANAFRGTLRCSRRPASRRSPVAGRTPRRRSGPSSGSRSEPDLRHPPPSGRPSSARVDTAPPRRLDCRPASQIARPRLALLEAPSE